MLPVLLYGQIFRVTGHFETSIPNCIVTSPQNVRVTCLRNLIMFTQLENNMLVQAKYFNFNHDIYSFRYEEARLWNSWNPDFKDVDSL